MRFAKGRGGNDLKVATKNKEDAKPICWPPWTQGERETSREETEQKVKGNLFQKKS